MIMEYLMLLFALALCGVLLYFALSIKNHLDSLAKDLLE